LIVDDIVETGRTLEAMIAEVRKMNPASLRTCVLLRKKLPDPSRYQPDLVGFDVPDEFVVGYGLDYDNLYRNVPEICVLRKHAETSS
jgi:hypoxanthine phosphoribosyltransferase